MMKLIIRSMMFGYVLFVSGCVSLLPETAPPKPRYHIDAVDATELTGGVIDWSLIVDDPRSSRVYDSIRIAVSTGRGRIEYFAGAEWADRAPRLFQTALVQSFEDSARILAVGDRSAVPVGSFVLQTDIRKLQLDVTDRTPRTTVSIYARLTDGKGKINAARLFKAEEVAGSDKADDVVSAFDVAFDTLINELVLWTYEVGEEAMAAKS